MKEYKVVNLNKAIHMSRDKDLAQMEENINALVAEGTSRSPCPIRPRTRLISNFS